MHWAEQAAHIGTYARSIWPDILPDMVGQDATLLALFGMA
jgi:hypothetical protein